MGLRGRSVTASGRMPSLLLAEGLAGAALRLGLGWGFMFLVFCRSRLGWLVTVLGGSSPILAAGLVVVGVGGVLLPSAGVCVARCARVFSRLVCM